MSDKFMPVSPDSLAKWVFTELDTKKSIFGIPQEMFFVPGKNDPFPTEIYGKKLETPFGAAAGPHTQMAQNIITAWLCGARFIELKTIQTLDELEISKPCIDMLDTGYNVEWSQELRIKESFSEYLIAWVLIHALHKKLKFPGKTPGVIFNISVGYNMEGILKDNVQWFLKNMTDADPEKDRYAEIVSKYCPGIKGIDIPARLSDNVTLSTMHGCPPDEIGRIATYLIEKWGFHTNVKLNPTLLGPETLRGILNRELGYREITVPDIAFGHDLKYPDALELIRDLEAKAKRKNVIFGVKLSNTLEVINHRDVFNKKEKMMYLSGRPLHAITVSLARKLSNEFKGGLLMSFAGGADCFNVAELLRCGMKTITVCSDILRPGGYTRMLQYFEETVKAYEKYSAKNTDEFICKTASKISGGKAPAQIAGGKNIVRNSALINLNQYADSILSDPLLHRDRFERKHTKTSRILGLFDCIKAPCTDECPVNQKAPVYINCVCKGELKEADAIMRADNPIPAILGRACSHQCEKVCTRTHYDDPIAIREIKRFITDREHPHKLKPGSVKSKSRIAIIGAGPCGLSTARFLAGKGYKVTVFEALDAPSGMVGQTIPHYRATQDSIDNDVRMLEKLGIKFEFGFRAGRKNDITSIRNKGFKYIVIAAGAMKGMKIGIENEDANGVIDGIEFLRQVRMNGRFDLGARVGVVGAGDVAMDCARTANRLTGGSVSVIYRRTIEEMPAHKEELDALLEEGISIHELLAPKAAITENGRLVSLRCAKMKLGEPDESGRRRPVEIPGESEDIPLDNLIIATGQTPVFDFFGGLKISLNKKGYINVNPETMETSEKHIYAGGDAVENGPQTIVKACGDGKKIAAAIHFIETSEKLFPGQDSPKGKVDYTEFLKKKARRVFRIDIPALPPEKRHGFDEIISTLSGPKAREEAERCLRCDLLCSTCATVCPNRAIFTYKMKPLEASIPVLGIFKGRVIKLTDETFSVKQGFQTAIYTPFCNECGNCAQFCPTSGRPYADKPRFYNDFKDFNAQDSNAFLVSKKGGVKSISAKFDGKLYELALGKNIECSGPGMKIELDKKSFSLVKGEIEHVPGKQQYSLKNFAVMHYLLEAVSEFMPELPVNNEK